MVTEPVCGDCERTAFVDRHGRPVPACAFVVMAPGRDGKEWHLCGGCYNDGRKVRVRRPEMTPEPVSQEFIDALKSTGWKVTDNGYGIETVSPPDRKQAPRRRARG